MLVKELRGQHAGWDMSQDVQVTGRDGMSQEEGESPSEEALTKWGREAGSSIESKEGERRIFTLAGDHLPIRSTLHLFCAPRHSQMHYFKGSLAFWFLVQPLENLSEDRRQEGLDIYSPDWMRLTVPWLKVTNHSRQTILQDSPIPGFDNNSFLPHLRWPLFLAPGSCTILCGFSTPYLYFSECSLFKAFFECSYFECAICFLSGTLTDTMIESNSVSMEFWRDDR